MLEKTRLSSFDVQKVSIRRFPLHVLAGSAAEGRALVESLQATPPSETKGPYSERANGPFVSHFEEELGL